MQHKKIFRRTVRVFCFLLMSGSSVALASSGGGGLPWESPLQTIQQSITGPTMGFVALAAVAVAGAMLIFGGELNDFGRRVIYIILVLGLMLGSAQIVALFGATGASIADSRSILSDMTVSSYLPGHKVGEDADV